ncbi:VPLPA-CTERM-specific exosortase XrtD [Desulfovulcanus sp.]
MCGYIALYFDSAQILINKRWNTDDYSYCYLVPFVAAYLAWQLRDRFSGLPKGSVIPGYILLVFSGVLFFTGRLGSLETFVYISMWLSIVAIVGLVLGSEGIKRFSFPLFILAFIVPAPPFITNLITFKLRLISSKIAVNILHFLGMSVYREGNVIDLGITKLQVVDACSGLRYLLPTILVSLIVGYLNNKRIWQRVVLVLFSIPVSILINSSRIVLMAYIAWDINPTMVQEGFLHDFLGWLIFFFSIAFVFLTSVFLRKFTTDRDVKTKKQQIASTPQNKTDSLKWAHAVAGFAIFIGLYFFQNHLVSAQIIPQRKTFASFPAEINGWTGKKEYLSQKILKSLWADDYVSGVYFNPRSGNTLHLLISYYQAQTTQHTAHAPLSCLLGSGYGLQQKKIIQPDAANGRSFPVAQMVLLKNGQKVLSNFWFQQRGRIITNEYMNKLYLIRDSIMMRRTDGALVRVEMLMHPFQSVQQAQKILDTFIVPLEKLLSEYVPGRISRAEIRYRIKQN